MSRDEMRSDNMKQSDDNKYIPMTSVKSGKGYEAAPDLYYHTIQIVNIMMYGNPEDGSWVLIDAGMPKSSSAIFSVVNDRFGKNTPPSAIILTHGHFDHVGAIVDLVREWNVPVYAHRLETPFLTGEQNYPEPDPSAEGGMLGKMASVYPFEPISIGEVLHRLPEDNSVPGMEGWRWIHTPGHAPGHVSLFRESDRLLIAGDAVVTVRQDQIFKVLMQKAELNGPPRYFTYDWEAAWESARKLEALNPEKLISGHGPIMQGEELRRDFSRLVREFDKLAIPDHGRYVNRKEG